MSNKEARNLKKLLEKLGELQKQTDYQFEVFKINNIRAWKDLWKPLVKDATWLEKNGCEDLALSVLDQASLAGFTNSWTEESRAKILAKLDRWEEALPIWKKLTKSKNKSIKEADIKAIDDQLDQQKCIEELLSKLHNIIQETGRKAKYLTDTKLTRLNEFEEPILAEASRFLKSELAEVSLKILEASLKAGLQTSAIEEKRAKTLLELKRHSEAAQICERLLASTDANAKQSAQTILKQQSEMLLTKIRKLMSAEDQPISDLPKKPPAQLSKLEQPILKQSKELLNKKQPELTLRLLKTSISFGLCTDPIKEMQARALLKSKSYSEAVKIWQELINSDNPELKQTAKTMLRQQTERLHSTLRKFVLAENLPIQHLPEQPPGKLLKLEQPLIEETNALLKNNKDGLALRLLNTSIKHGLDTDLLKENQAKALLSRNRVNEAVSTWQSLLESENKKARDSAQKNLDLHLKTGIQQDLVLKVNNLLQESSNKDKAFDTAIDLLTDALLQDPTSEILQKCFQEIAVKRANKNVPDNSLPELINHQGSIAGLEAFLSSLEKRQQALLNQSATHNEHVKHLPEVHEIKNIANQPQD